MDIAWLDAEVVERLQHQNGDLSRGLGGGKPETAGVEDKETDHVSSLFTLIYVAGNGYRRTFDCTAQSPRRTGT